MANSFHLSVLKDSVLKDGALSWNQLRPDYFDSYVAPGLEVMVGNKPMDEVFEDMGELIRKPDLEGLQETSLSQYDLSDANLRNAQLSGADLHSANFYRADLTGADLTYTNLRFANLHGANLTGADLRGSALEWARIVNATVQGARFSDARVHGVSAWRLRGEPADQTNLVITGQGEPPVFVDSLKLAHFIYLLTEDADIRETIDTITSKVVLILGRFTADRKAVLVAIQNTLRSRGLLPIVFDFDRPATKDTTGTVETLARMARFIVADLTDPSSIPHELATTVPFLRTTPVVLLRLEGSTGYSMVEDLEAYDRWVIPVREYPDPSTLIGQIESYVIEPANERLQLLRPEVNPG